MLRLLTVCTISTTWESLPRQFLAIKEACLVLLFEYSRASKLYISNFKNIQRRYEHRDERTAYSMIVDKSYPTFKYNNNSSIRGNKVILPYPKSKSNFWPYNQSWLNIHD